MKKFIKNIYRLFTEDITKKDISRAMIEMEKSIQYNHLYQRVIAAGIINGYKEETIELINSGSLKSFPYKRIKNIKTIDYGIDKDTSLPYVMHEGKRLYFPESWPLNLVMAEYTDFIEEENLLGGNYSEKSPHQYQSNNVFIEKGDIVFDLGCAEGLFALDCIENAKKCILVEVKSDWQKPLQKTFQPYRNKVEIINKIISTENTESSIRLEQLLEPYHNESIFIKMDIEGAEYMILNSGEELLKSGTKIKIACCVYHNSEDEIKISKLLKDYGFNIEVSDGFILFTYDKKFNYPFFRRGLIRAFKN